MALSLWERVAEGRVRANSAQTFIPVFIGARRRSPARDDIVAMTLCADTRLMPNWQIICMLLAPDAT